MIFLTKGAIVLRPSTKENLIKASNEEFEKLQKLIDTMSSDEQNAKFSFEDMDKRKYK